MLGIRNPFSSLVRATRLRPTDHETLAVWLSPSVPRWDYVPVTQTWRLIRCERDGSAIYGYLESKRPGEVIVDFVRLHLPREDEICTIVDGHQQILIGWVTTEHGTVWAGCAFGFRLLNLAARDGLISEVDVAIWESMAHDAAHMELRRQVFNAH